ncbi:PspC domain-containing protein [soil metagenome]
MPPRRLVRLPREGKVAGVAAGMAAYLGLDPVLVRIGLVVLTIATGMGIPLYIAGWVLMPAADEATTSRSAAPPDGKSILGIALVVGAGVLLLGRIDLFSAPVLLAALLIGGGVMLFTDGDPAKLLRGGPLGPPGRHIHGRGHDCDTPSTDTDNAAAPSEGSTSDPTGTSSGSQPRSAYDPYGAAWQPTPTRGDTTLQRPRSVLGPLAFAAWLAAMGLGTLMNRFGVPVLTPRTALAITITIAGVALLIGTIFGRARGLIIIGIICTLLLLPLSFAESFGVPLRAGVGERVFTPVVVEDLQPYDLLAGIQVIDLTQLDLDGETAYVSVSMGAGELVVRVPDNVAVTVAGRMQVGEHTLFGQAQSGTALPLRAEQAGDPDRGSIELDINVLAGDVVVEAIAPR